MIFDPDSWSRERVATEFQGWVYVVRTARKLKEEKGIFPVIKAKLAGNRLLQTTIDAVTKFYLDEKISKYCRWDELLYNGQYVRKESARK